MSSRITRLYHTGTPEGRDPRSPLTAPRRNTGGSWSGSISANATFPGAQPGAWRPQPRGCSAGALPASRCPSHPGTAQETCWERGSCGSPRSPAKKWNTKVGIFAVWKNVQGGPSRSNLKPSSLCSLWAKNKFKSFKIQDRRRSISVKVLTWTSTTSAR